MTDMLKRQAHTDMTERRESLDGIGEQSEERMEVGRLRPGGRAAWGGTGALRQRGGHREKTQTRGKVWLRCLGWPEGQGAGRWGMREESGRSGAGRAGAAFVPRASRLLTPEPRRDNRPE